MKKEIINDREVISINGARYYASKNLLIVKGLFRFMNVTKKSIYKGVEQKYKAEIIIPHSEEAEKLLKFIYRQILEETKGDKTAAWIRKIFGDKRKGFVYDPALDDVDFDTITDKERKYRKDLEGKLIVKSSTMNEPKLFYDRRNEEEVVYTVTKQQYADLVGQWDGFGSEGYMALTPYEYDGNVFAYLRSVSLTKIHLYDDALCYDPDTGEELNSVPYNQKSDGDVADVHDDNHELEDEIPF